MIKVDLVISLKRNEARHIYMSRQLNDSRITFNLRV